MVLSSRVVMAAIVPLVVVAAAILMVCVRRAVVDFAEGGPVGMYEPWGGVKKNEMDSLSQRIGVNTLGGRGWWGVDCEGTEVHIAALGGLVAINAGL